MEAHLLVAATTLLALLTYFWMGVRVARARREFGVAAPATTGDETFERVFRAQQNTLEWLPLFLPSLWLFALYWDGAIAAILGVVWIFGRIAYGLGYARAANARGVGFLVQGLAVGVLLFGALGRIVWLWLQAN
jgi:glutathione S-transferase